MKELARDMNYTAEIDRDACIGSGNCVTFVPEAFALDDEGMAVFIPTISVNCSALQEAAEACPTGAISVHEHQPADLGSHQQGTESQC